MQVQLDLGQALEVGQPCVVRRRWMPRTVGAGGATASRLLGCSSRLSLPPAKNLPNAPELGQDVPQGVRVATCGASSGQLFSSRDGTSSNVLHDEVLQMVELSDPDHSQFCVG